MKSSPIPGEVCFYLELSIAMYASHTNSSTAYCFAPFRRQTKFSGSTALSLAASPGPNRGISQNPATQIEERFQRKFCTSFYDSPNPGTRNRGNRAEPAARMRVFPQAGPQMFFAATPPI